MSWRRHCIWRQSASEFLHSTLSHSAICCTWQMSFTEHVRADDWTLIFSDCSDKHRSAPSWRFLWFRLRPNVSIYLLIYLNENSSWRRLVKNNVVFSFTRIFCHCTAVWGRPVTRTPTILLRQTAAILSGLHLWSVFGFSKVLYSFFFVIL